MTPDPHDLQRFLDAQEGTWPQALAELRQGRKRTHWSWFVLPQLRGLGSSPTAQRYGISGLAEARAYARHPVLGARLREAVGALLVLPPDATPEGVLGGVDALKLRSCLTLFAAADPDEPSFPALLGRWWGGEPDPETVRRLA